MATSKTTIELNGKLYDARTGKIIGEASNSAKPAPQATHSNGAVLDGFTRRTQANHSAPAALAPKSKPATARTVPAPVSTKLQKSKTLMRPAVKKPSAVVKHTSPHSHQHEIAKKADPARQIRATSTPKSDAVQRFNHAVNNHTVIKKEAHLPVVSPAHHHVTEQIAHIATSTEAHLKQSVDVIEESLRNASAHLEKFDEQIGRKKFLDRAGFGNRAANIASLSFAGLLLCGFFAYQNAPNIEMRVAAARAGVSAQMPGYNPAGFSPSRGLKTEPGKVAVTFRSNTDDRAFTVTQQASNWSSDSLLSNHVLASKQPYQTYQDEGKTVYIYDNSNATWVNGGIWYKVDGTASLTSDQLLRIANSF